MRTSGLTLDVYDDTSGEQLREIYPSPDVIPTFVKSASALDEEQRSKLPDDLFALVIQGEGQVLRKFACYDSGNTELSLLYFLKNQHKLPEDVQQKVASNLCIACDWYGIKPPEELKDVAAGTTIKVGGVLGAIGRTAINNPARTLMAPSVIQGTGHEIQRNVAATRAAQQANDSPVVTPEEMRHFKGAEVVGTSDMPLQRPTKHGNLSVVRKTGAAQRMDIYKADRTEAGKPDTNEVTKGKAPVSAPKMNPHMDVTGKTAGLEVPQYFEHYALGNRYPIDSIAQIKMASAYFQEFGPRFSPSDRHEYCLNLVKRANHLGIELDRSIRKYGASTYAPADEIEMALTMRKNALKDPTAVELLDKIAAARPQLPPQAFAEVLEEFDKVASINVLWDEYIYDPYFSTYGTSEKTASEKTEEFVDIIANSRITGPQLKDVAHTKSLQLKDVFGEDFANEFRKDPIGIYKSMPREQKLMIINLASDNAPGVRGSPE